MRPIDGHSVQADAGSVKVLKGHVEAVHETDVDYEGDSCRFVLQNDSLKHEVGEDPGFVGQLPGAARCQVAPTSKQPYRIKDVSAKPLESVLRPSQPVGGCLSNGVGEDARRQARGEDGR